MFQRYWRELLAVFVLLIIIFFLPNDYMNNYKEFYKSSLRGQLASIFIAVAAFLFSLKSFIVIKMYESVYSRDNFKVNFLKEHEEGGYKEDDLYSTLENLNGALLVSVIFSIIAGVYHLLLGGLLNIWFLKIGLFLTLYALTSLVLSIITYQSNLSYWFNFIRKNWKDTEKNIIRKKIDKEKELNKKKTEEDLDIL